MQAVKELSRRADPLIRDAINEHYGLAGHLPGIVMIRAPHAEYRDDEIQVLCMDTWGVDGPIQDRIDQVKRLDDTATAWVFMIGSKFVVRSGGIALRTPRT